MLLTESIISKDRNPNIYILANSEVKSIKYQDFKHVSDTLLNGKQDIQLRLLEPIDGEDNVVKINGEFYFRFEKQAALYNSIIEVISHGKVMGKLQYQDYNPVVKNTKTNGLNQIENITRYSILKYQFNTWPTSFAVKRIEQKVCDETLFEWTTSKSPKGKKISYTLFVSSDFLFKDSLKLVTKYTNDTTLLFTEKLPSGKYYWKVTATDGEFFIDGFNSKNVFEKVTCTYLPNSISEILILKKNGSPYVLNQTISIEKNAKLIIEKGVEIRLDTGVNILVHGNFMARGTRESPIVFRPMQKAKAWGYFYFFNTKADFDYTSILEGKINSKYTDLSIRNTSINIKKKRLVFGVNRNPIIWTHHGSFLLENSIIDGKGTGEGINTNFSKSIVRNSTFINLPDAIEFICVDEGLIENCMIKNSPDDAIDLNACHNIIVRNNVILNNSDKGISVGKEQYGHSSNILIDNNIILGNNIGIAVKDSSFAVVKNNLFYENKIGISVYRKDTSSIGGDAEINNNVFYKNSTAISADGFSNIRVGVNISDGILPFGTTKISSNLADSIDVSIYF